jgi:murein DD-endopeptidase MepM/ murein hydrolase activator NlpD
MNQRLGLLTAILLPIFAGCSVHPALVKRESTSKKSDVASVSVQEKVAQSSQEDGAFHIVGEGETLKHICDVYGLDFLKVAKINKILPPHTLEAGQTVFLPAEALLAETDSPGTRGKVAASSSSNNRDYRSVLANAIRGKRDPIVPELKFPILGGTLSSPFGFRWGRFHKGLDISSPVGTSIHACADGRVVFTGSRKGFRRYGTTVLVDHGKGVYTYYAHLSGVLVKANQKVKRGQKIALVGNTGRSTGPHLHLEVRVNNTMYNPLAYFSPSELAGTMVARRFAESPMGPVRAGWRIPDLLSSAN